MVDNVTADPGSGGATFRTDDDGTAHWPYTKIAYGADDTQTIVTASIGLPVVLLAGSAEIGNVKNSGTFAVQAAQSGTWNVTNISGVVSLPTGAATAAKQLPDGHAVTIDNASVPIAGVDAENAAATANPVLSGGRYDVSARVLDDGDAGALALDSSGHLITSGHGESVSLSDNISNTVNMAVDESGGFIGYANFGFMYDGTAWDRVRGDEANGLLVNLGTNNDVNAIQSGTWNLNNISGTISLPTGAATSAGQLADGHNVTADNAGGAAAVNIQDGGNSITVDNNGTFAVQSAINAGTNLIGDVGIGVRTSGGTTLYKNIDVDETEDQVNGTAGQVYWIHAINTTAAIIYLKFYNATAASVTVGTTVPDLTFPVPGNSTTGAGFTLTIPNGIEFSTAITIAATTGVADDDSGAPGANALICNLGYA